MEQVAQLKEPLDTTPRHRVWVVQCGARSRTAFQLGIFCDTLVQLRSPGRLLPATPHRTKLCVTGRRKGKEGEGREGRSKAPPRAPPEGPLPLEATSGGALYL